MNNPPMLPPPASQPRASTRLQSRTFAFHDADAFGATRVLQSGTDIETIEQVWANAIAAESQTSMRYTEWAACLLAADCKDTAQLFHILSEFSISQALDYARLA